MKLCLDLFAGLGGFSAAFEDAEDWEVVTVDNNPELGPVIVANVLDLSHDDFNDDYDVVLASPPCPAFSMAASGTHLDSDGRPKTEFGRVSLELVHHTVGLIKGLDPEWYFIENPMGGMRRELGEPDAHVWWCQYGADVAKPTDLWGRIPPSFRGKKCYNGNERCHHEKSPRGAKTGTQADDKSSQERARIPYGLSEAILDAVMDPGVSEPSTIQQTLPNQ